MCGANIKTVRVSSDKECTLLCCMLRSAPCGRKFVPMNAVQALNMNCVNDAVYSALSVIGKRCGGELRRGCRYDIST